MLYHDFRSWLYLLNAEVACVIAQGRSKDTAPHTAVQVPATKAIDVFVCLHPEHAAQRAALLAFVPELRARNFKFSKLNWSIELQRAGL